MNLKDFKIKNHLTTILRHFVQIVAFILINFIILELIFSINLKGIEELFKILPILNSPRNPLSKGAGILEYAFFSITEGVIPIFLLGVFILIILFTNRFFCGWICPIGTIQDACAAIPTKKRTLKISTHNSLLKIKYVIIIFLIILLLPLSIIYSYKSPDISFYIEFRNNLGDFGDKPLSYFSLSEYIFVFFPDLVKEIFQNASLGPLFTNFLVFFISIFYLIIIVLSVWYPRVYCRYLCPFAALSSAISDFSFLKLSRSPVKCVGRTECGICEKVCPKQIRILDEPFEFFTGKGECNYCLKCKEACPYNAIDIKFG
ncbi:MAG: 4Fe-4S binding protein [Candidatus Lokiarchaeota archaeon]|nr:4Fe-4S binding protein [Candidatus Lokiarchaeota archaeon]